MRVLITRPLDDAQRIAGALRAMGHAPVVVPLMEVRFFDVAVALDGVQAILATSANGVRGLARLSERRDLPLFAVGPQTAQAARDAGFTNVRDAQGDARALAEAASHWAAPGSGALLHVKGVQGAALAVPGLEMKSVIVYDVVPVRPPPALPGDVDVALFFSPASARIFKDAASGFPANTVVAVCISRAVADALSPLHFREIRVAAAPNQEELLASL
jgi:uroporphyrinogen-III synthase